jgi:hypothetical protein
VKFVISLLEFGAIYVKKVTCTGTDDIWVDQGRGFVVHYAAMADCTGQDGQKWQTSWTTDVMEVDQMRTIGLPEGATIVR